MRVAFVIPCLNEEAAIAEVVFACRRAIPGARVCVFDNLSTDATAARAREAGAEVFASPNPGKGCVVRHAFAEIDADYYVMLDGDGTYPASDAGRLVDHAARGSFHMVNGARLQRAPARAFRPLHFAGNRGFTLLVRVLFGAELLDLLTGFRVFSREFVSETRLTSRGFEIETELTLRALGESRRIAELPVDYGVRTAGGVSKLRTFRDGWRILGTIARLFLEYRLKGQGPASRETAAPVDRRRAS